MKSEADLSYSLEALRVKAMFYGKKAMVYVEGEDDLSFWDPYFDRTIFEIEQVGGCHNLDGYIQKLEDGEASYIVACDADYRSFCGSEYKSPLIVTTYGHSIENKMYCPYNLSELARKLSKSTNDYSQLILKWYEDFTNTVHPLLVREITNLTYLPKAEKPVVFGDTCARYCKLSPCYELDNDRIQKFCEMNKAYFPDDELKKTEEAIASDGRSERDLIKGHFLTEGVRRFMIFLSSQANTSGKRENISKKDLYTMTVHCENCRQDACTDKEHINTQVAKAIINLNIIA